MPELLENIINHIDKIDRNRITTQQTRVLKRFDDYNKLKGLTKKTREHHGGAYHLLQLLPLELYRGKYNEKILYDKREKNWIF